MTNAQVAFNSLGNALAPGERDRSGKKKIGINARLTSILVAALLSLLMGGCTSNSIDETPPTTRPIATDIPAEQATANFWYDQPAVTSVESSDFQAMWDACARTLRNDQFEVDRSDYRLGLMTSQPVISKQVFEFWRSDAGNFHEVMRSTLQSVRRTIRFEFERSPDGRYIMTPKVLVEQASHPERRITAYSQYSVAFVGLGDKPTRETTGGAIIPNSYWYSLGRDTDMEKQLANSVREKLEK